MGGWSGIVGLSLLAVVALPCFVTLPWSLWKFDPPVQEQVQRLAAPTLSQPLGTDFMGRSLLWRCMLGGAVSLGMGTAAAALAVIIGTGWGTIAGYAGGRMDAAMMRGVDVLMGLPYTLLVVLMNLALEPGFVSLFSKLLPADFPVSARAAGGVATLVGAIASVSWLSLSRVVRGQVLSLRQQPFVEAARACGLSPARIVLAHVLPNLIGPVIVYTTLTVHAAILQESFLSFLGIGVQAPLPSWGNLAADGLEELYPLLMRDGGPSRWWLLVWPCVMLALSLVSLHLLGDALRRRFDPRAFA